jgi:hypothetical protein
MEYLNDHKIRYYIRIRKNFIVHNPRTGKELKAFVMFADIKCGQCKILYRIYRVNRQLCYLSASKVKGKDGKPELQIIISFNQPQDAQDVYKDRWQIETAFKGLKSSGFNIEQTHLTDLKRIEKLFTIVMLAFAWAYVVGVFFPTTSLPPFNTVHRLRRQRVIFRFTSVCLIVASCVFSKTVLDCPFPKAF